MVQWSASYHPFALACAAVGMWDWHLAIAHHTTCMKVACECYVSHVLRVMASCSCVLSFAGRANSLHARHQLAQVYDETCRKEWAERSFRGDSDFDMATAPLQIDQELLQRALEAYQVEYPKSHRNDFVQPVGNDRIVRSPQPQRAGKFRKSGGNKRSAPASSAGDWSKRGKWDKKW